MIRYGSLVFIEEAGMDKFSHRRWKFLCDCGNEHIANKQDVVIGKTKSCGCEKFKPNIGATIHGHARYVNGKPKITSTYRTWYHMKDRCYNPSNKSYKWYGAKGITVCVNWLDSFKNFLEDMGESSIENSTIDRIDPKGNYEKSNCRWISRRENSRRAHLGIPHK